ncbi:MAG: hypothetical protein J07HQW1_00511 [Haloquadratum walsbyi J07HQW1]|jgi:hypothetical protein|uniref:ACR n=1 Tax=Haloquadratum walsbyi J07HQW1 TaxID=1238424 RepID=U1MLG1_9EURY|nr:MAG: hypothetical protein J07HQW1_00511 [Haloquadratum walsbyi J07HQW1]
MHLEHISRTDGSVKTLATDVEIATTLCARVRGLMFRRDFSIGSALVFRFNRVSYRRIHMLFVYTDLDVLWLKDNTVSECAQLSAWYGIGTANADTVIELPAGVADAVTVGDTVQINIDI